MIVIHIYFRNGLRLEYNFPGIGTAKVIYDRLSNALLHKELVSIDDYGGRSASLDPAQVQAITLIDIEAEAKSVVQVNALVEEAAQAGLRGDRRQRGAVRPQAVDGGPLPRHDA